MSLTRIPIGSDTFPWLTRIGSEIFISYLIITRSFKEKQKNLNNAVDQNRVKFACAPCAVQWLLVFLIELSEINTATQCCGSGMFIPDPGSRVVKIPDPHKEVKYFLTQSTDTKFSKIRSVMFPGTRI
jgi:hypothetical protein